MKSEAKIAQCSRCCWGQRRVTSGERTFPVVSQNILTGYLTKELSGSYLNILDVNYQLMDDDWAGWPVKSLSASHEYIHWGSSELALLVDGVFDITWNAINSAYECTVNKIYTP